VTRPVLYSFRRCPYAMRARMALMTAGETVELREVLLKDKPAAMLQASPKGTVPVLVLSDGRVIDESLDVMDWALARHDPEDWLRSRNDPLIAENDGPFKHHLDRYKYATRYDGANPEEHRAAGVAFLEKLTGRLVDTPHLSGDMRSFVDVAVFPFVRQFRIADPDWFDAHAPAPVRRWLDGLVSSALFSAVLKKYDVWEPGG